MKISHETPIDLLSEFEFINDYDYALVHLMEIPEYKQYFVNALKKGRTVYFDNSVFELGVAFNFDKFVRLAIEYGSMAKREFVAIAPDVLDDTDKSVENLIKFKEEIGKSTLPNVKVMGVLQGKTITDLYECYHRMVKYADIIGINHISIAFEPQVRSRVDFLDFYEKSENRINFVKALCENDDYNADLHLLGILHPWEICALSKYSQIVSADTSNPVCFALEGASYTGNIIRKPLWSLHNWIETCNTMNPSQKMLAIQNAIQFKNFILENII